MTYLSQVIVAVNVVGIDEQSTIAYTYTDPQTGQLHVQSPSCLVDAQAPYQVLFALDYASSRNGWIFGSKPPVRAGAPAWTDVFANDLAIGVRLEDSNPCRYNLILTNRFTRQTICPDPQEGNIRQPT